MNRIAFKTLVLPVLVAGFALAPTAAAFADTTPVAPASASGDVKKCVKPTAKPTAKPSAKPTPKPSAKPTTKPCR